MRPVAEIETAVEKLSSQELREFAACFEEKPTPLNSSEALFLLCEEEEHAS